ncbi:TlpA disulfide reductase family protein [Pusillimonas sp. SM2304]|uniref:TlpA disulfide reductase family protein n=1 Tax=Pusillimonas sp. SM2304 TaxID=3073241 RepID=UPI0028750413|nr:TlpA disulfide reductase family protein [Pusillimonas sp. SM2304]MDS1142265.1 TlpA disulfide reductase family protein [Pusillimonas sp. SM2304]
MSGIGPFPIQVVTVIAAVLLAWLTARIVGRRMPDVPYKAAGSMILDAVVWGLLAARLAYIAQWREDYLAAPRSMIAIGDGGFIWWVGVLVVVAYIWRRTRSTPILRVPVLAGVMAGVVAWVVAGGVLALLLRSAPPLPDLQLATLDERPVSLSAYAGRPIVLNLWASWCPPCRREMPVLEQAQTAFPGVSFVLVNQGESAQQAKEFLQNEGLNLTDVLLDPSSEAMRKMRTGGLPTTFFFDAQGRMVDLHLGEITMSVLKDKASRHF